MKFSNLLAFTGAAVTSFYLVKNREKIMDEAVETYDSINSIQQDLQNIQKNVQIIQAQKSHLEAISQDLTCTSSANTRYLECSQKIDIKRNLAFG